MSIYFIFHETAEELSQKMQKLLPAIHLRSKLVNCLTLLNSYTVLMRSQKLNGQIDLCSPIHMNLYRTCSESFSRRSTMSLNLCGNLQWLLSTLRLLILVAINGPM